MNKGQLFRYGSIIFLVFFFFRIAWWSLPDIFGVLELRLSDQLMQLAYSRQGRQEISPDIVHVDLDDQSLSDLPYPKNDPRLYAELIRILSAAGVKTVLMDMLFPNCGEEECRRLTTEVRQAGNIHFPVITSSSAPSFQKGHLAGQAYWTIAGQDDRDFINGKIFIANYEGLNEAAAGLGHINCPPDPDGVYRRIPLFIRDPSGLVPSLSLRSICHYLGLSTDHIRLDGQHVTLIHATLPGGATRDIHIPVDRRANNRINFSGPWNDSFAHYSFATILSQGASPSGLPALTDELEDALVIVSDVSTGGRDFGPIPLSSYFPLSGLHGHFINSILTDSFLKEIDFRYNLLLDFMLVILLTAAAVYSKGYRLALIATVVYGGFIAAALYLFWEYRIAMPAIRPSISFIAALLAIMFFQFLDVQKEKQHIRTTLTSYFAPSLMEKILNDPELIKGVSRKELTILFSDIVGFTAWSSSRDAEEIHQTLNHYFEEMATIVFAHGGTIDKYIGDGLMVFFGDPVPLQDHALRAVMAAQDMQRKTAELKKQWEQTGGMPIEIRIGIHTGETVVGNMGSRARMDYTVIGSNVNLAQRLESNCPPGGILISEQVYRQLDGAIAARTAGTIQAKGFSSPVTVYTVV